MQTNPPADLDKLKSAIRSAGLRATGPRIAVLRRLRAASRPLSHAEVMDALGEQAALDRATVYRNLADLSRVGLLRRYDLGDHVWRYESTDEHTHDAAGHAHFVCVECGDVTCIDDVELRIPPAALPQALLGTDLEIQLKGVCGDCT